MRIRIHPTAVFIVLIPVFGLLSWGEAALLWSCAALHEGGHLLAYRICKSRIKTLWILPFGICANPENPVRLSPKNEIFCAAAGPALNLLAATALLALPFPAQAFFPRYALYCNGALCLINLFPVLPLDGGRILYFALAQKTDLFRCEELCRRIAGALLLLTVIPSFMSLWEDKNPSFFLVWGYLAGYTLLRRGSI